MYFKIFFLTILLKKYAILFKNQFYGQFLLNK